VPARHSARRSIAVPALELTRLGPVLSAQHKMVQHKMVHRLRIASTGIMHPPLAGKTATASDIIDMNNRMNKFLGV
jgi:hypothetical protein